jgi:glycosyltransferase involved in cell wall biosynthesis
MKPHAIATISIFPAKGQEHSSASQLSALAAYTRSLLLALPEPERQRHAVLSNIKDHAGAEYNLDHLHVFEVWRKGTWRYALDILRAIRSMPALRLVHLQHEFNQFGGISTIPFIPFLAWTLRRRKIKLVITYHEVVGRELLALNQDDQFCLPVPVWAARIIFKTYYRWLSRAADCILVQHPKFKAIMEDEMGVRTPVEILPIGTETAVSLADRGQSRAQWGYGEDERILLFFGTLDWRKGLDIMLDAFEALPAKGRYRLLIGGGQPVRIKHKPAYQKWYTALSERMRHNDRITHVGFVADADIPKLFAASDLVLLPYVVPQMVSAVLNHAASYECPFIGSTAFAGHADPHVLFEPTGPALAEKIQWSFDGHMDDLLRYARSYKHMHSWTRSATLLSGYYRTVLDQKG